ncbi:hypothetical protein H3T48_02010 [Lactobacillus sp. M0403]|uniref:hypothetical protein n=1 Tax=Lactobacillus TaxID=1578 RepID=UPI000D6B8E2F|nr:MULTISPECIES: hypothetical protein [Lactobacillus]AWM74395.1 hypothetical protein DKL56_07670 [Lactobacillus apis]MBC6361344.1 hypothetical protein [Lactobacillus apis]MBI0092486.1 hypothetical protein [Lactobacillus sp. M0403]MCT6821405.1 hypothetical protein [Lactobacillus apis]MCT6876864.1 hypothetical protein [Lactobacillus apis]
MSRKKIELNGKVEKLAEKYLQITGTDLDDLTNAALKAYLIDHLNSNQIKEALKDSDDISSEYAGKLFNLDDLNRF